MLPQRDDAISWLETVKKWTRVLVQCLKSEHTFADMGARGLGG